MSDTPQSDESLPLLATVEAGTADRLRILDNIRERMKQESLSSLEDFIMQKAIALFLLGERVGWTSLYSRVAIDGFNELSQLNLSDKEEENEVVQAIASLESKGLLHFEDDDENRDTIMRICAISENQSFLVRSLYQHERRNDQK
jgi:hypothetical protein